MPKRKELAPSKGYLVFDGAWDESTQSFGKVVVKIGDENAEGLTDEWIDFYRQMDLEMETADNREAAHKDPRFERMKELCALDPDENMDPFECIAESISYDPFSTESVFTESEIVEIIHGIIAELTETQRETIWDRYGMQKTLEEIANDSGVKKQAIYNREQKIVKTVRKLLIAKGITDDSFDHYGHFHR